MRSSRQKATTRRAWPTTATFWLLAWCLLGAIGLYTTHSSQPTSEPSLAASAARHATANPLKTTGRTHSYTTRAIEDIRPGDLVLARDEHGREIGFRPVVEFYPRIADKLRILDFKDSCGQWQQLQTTNEHPFWSVDRNEFVEAGHLRPGEHVTGPAGEIQTLIATRSEAHPEGVPVFNFKVEDYHTYYVHAPSPTYTPSTPLLVHNANDDYLKTANGDFIDAEDLANRPDIRIREPGKIYKVPESGTPSGKPYIGSSDNLKNRTESATDGRDRSQPEVLGHYLFQSERLEKERQAIIDAGGLSKMDNKIMPPDPKP